MPYLSTCDSNESEDERRKCTQSTMLKYIYTYLKYPNLAKETGVEGTVILSFVVDKNGKMTHLETVSYTHLDVYKRQKQYHTSVAFFGPYQRRSRSVFYCF